MPPGRIFPPQRGDPRRHQHLWVFGIGLQGEAQFFGGGEVSVTLVFDGHGGVGIALEVGARAGWMAALWISGSGFVNWDADTIMDIAGVGVGVSLGAVVASSGLQTSVQTKKNPGVCEPGENDYSNYLLGAQVSAIGPDVSLGVTLSVGNTWVWRLR